MDDDQMLSNFHVSLNGHELSSICALIGFCRDNDIEVLPEIDCIYEKIKEQAKCLINNKLNKKMEKCNED